MSSVLDSGIARREAESRVCRDRRNNGLVIPGLTRNPGGDSAWLLDAGVRRNDDLKPEWRITSEFDVAICDIKLDITDCDVKSEAKLS